MKRLLFGGTPAMMLLRVLTLILIAYQASILFKPGPSPNEALTEAIRNYEMEDMRAALNSGADANALVDFEVSHTAGQTLLNYALANGKPGPAILLMGYGARVEGSDSTGMSALMYAITMERGHQGITREVLKRSPNIREACKKHHNAPPLILAIDSAADVLPDLLRAGADINARDDRGYTALHCAVDNLDPNAVEILLAHNVDISLKNHQGQTPYDLALVKQKQVMPSGPQSPPGIQPSGEDPGTIYAARVRQILSMLTASKARTLLRPAR